MFVKYIRCDNAGENQVLERECKELGLGIKFEYTSPDTPQQNGVVERAFGTLWSRVRAMMNNAMFPRAQRDAWWAECASTATKLDNIMSAHQNERSPHENFYGYNPKYIPFLHTFGEMGVVTTHTNKRIRAKLENCGSACMFVGFADDHAGDVFRI